VSQGFSGEGAEQGEGHKVKRSLLISAFTLALLVLLSGTALATGKPVRVFIGGLADVPVPSCTFGVTVHVLVNKDYMLIFTGDHPSIITGSLKARITRDDAPLKGIDVNISGPAFITENRDGTTTVKFGGRSLISLPDRSGLWLTNGPATVVVGTKGETISLSLPHSTRDLCPVLAAL
jgi:hypothetical protein